MCRCCFLQEKHHHSQSCQMMESGQMNTTSEVIRKGQLSNVQTMADDVADWSNRNRVKLNTDKWNFAFLLLQLVMNSK